jgi:hypothetical protein
MPCRLKTAIFPRTAQKGTDAYKVRRRRESFGSSGRTWNRETLGNELRARGQPSAPATVSEMNAVPLAPDVVDVVPATDYRWRTLLAAHVLTFYHLSRTSFW